MNMIPHAEFLQYRADFPILQEKIYFNTCSLAPLSRTVYAAQQEFLEQWDRLGGKVWFAADGWWEKLERVRRRWAALIGAAPHEVALISSVSAGLSSIASALPYEKRNKIVMTHLEFPTLADQWLVRSRPQSVECCFIESQDRIGVPIEAFERSIDERTALIATSRVYYGTGYRQDVRALADLAHRWGALLLIDDYQAGHLPLDVHETGVDILVTGMGKWLLGQPGLGLLYIREGLSEQLTPTIAGWFGNRDQLALASDTFTFRQDARRMEMGTPAMGSVYAADAALSLIEGVGLTSISERSCALANDLIERCQEQGWRVRASHDPLKRSAIVCLEMDLALPMIKRLVSELYERYDILVDTRPGVLRIAPHFFNTQDENVVVVNAIAQILRMVTI